MKDPETLKQVVREKYGAIASAPLKKTCGCCSREEPDYSKLNLDYTGKEGYLEEADLELGCGIPTDHAGIRPGDHLLDLGSGAGNDCFVARSIVGDTGSVTGLDFTDEMVEKANHNNLKMGYTNVNFVKGDIENMPLPDNSYDVVISNCVLNLVPDKKKAFSEIRRVLKPGGHFCVSDIVLVGELPGMIRDAAELYAGCLSGALQKEAYLATIRDAGFMDVEIKEEKVREVPDDVLLPHVDRATIDSYRRSGAGVFSITVTGVA